MIDRLKRLLQQRRHRRLLTRWEAAAHTARVADNTTLRLMRREATQLRARIDAVSHVVDDRLASREAGVSTIRKPALSDWAHRPELWCAPLSPPGYAAVGNRTRIGEEATLYHDCTRSELSVRQMRNKGEADLALYGLRIDVFAFDGSFLSLVLELPENAASGLQGNHILQLDTEVETEKPLEMFARLNIKHGPNVEQIVREVPLGRELAVTEFDLAHAPLSDKRLEKLWIDIIFEGPQMNEIYMRDVTLSRRRRANF